MDLPLRDVGGGQEVRRVIRIEGRKVQVKERNKRILVPVRPSLF